MLIVFIRTIIIYFVLLIAVRVMGKGELSNMSPFQMIIMYIIAELAAIPIDNPAISLLNGIVAIFTLVLIQALISFISLKSEKFKYLIKGKPSLIIDKGKINMKKLKAMRITINDLMEQLRIEGVPSVSDIDYVILEANGQISILPKSNKQPLSGDFFNAPSEDRIVPIVLMCNGYVYEENLQMSGFSPEDVDKELKSMKIKSRKDVLMMVADENSKMHVYSIPKGEKIFSEEIKK